MKRSLPALAAVALLAAAVAAWSRPSSAPASASAAREATFLRLPPAASVGQLVLYGHIRSLTRKGSRYELRFDPAFFLEGVTAQHAAVEDKVLDPGQPVPNDNYTRDESHRLLTYVAPATARATVLTNSGTKGIVSTPVPVSELAQIVAGRNPRHRALFGEVTGFGFWVRVAVDAVSSLDEQYHP